MLLKSPVYDLYHFALSFRDEKSDIYIVPQKYELFDEVHLMFSDKNRTTEGNQMLFRQNALILPICHKCYGDIGEEYWCETFVKSPVTFK